MLIILTPKEFSLLDTFIVIFQIQHAVAMCCLKKLKKKKTRKNVQLQPELTFLQNQDNALL